MKYPYAGAQAPAPTLDLTKYEDHRTNRVPLNGSGPARFTW